MPFFSCQRSPERRFLKNLSKTSTENTKELLSLALCCSLTHRFITWEANYVVLLKTKPAAEMC